MPVDYSDSEIESALKLFNTLPDYVCWKNTKLEYVMLNDVTARMFGLSSSKISYDRISDFELQCDAVELAGDFRADDAAVLDTASDLTILEYCKYHEDEWKLLFGRKSLL